MAAGESMNPAQQPGEPDSRVESELKLEKLRCEVQQLKSQLGFRGRLAAFTPLLSAGIAVLGVWISLFQFQKQQEAAARKTETERAQREADAKRVRELELQNPFWQKRVQLYFDATEAAGIIASRAAGADRAKAEAAFWRLYLGPLAVVEDDQVESAMVEMGNCLNKTEDCDQTTLSKRALALAHSCRQSIGDTWRLGLTELKGKYQQLK
jgi:hypothetical protein